MSYTKRIVCLANSRKRPSGRCVVGREIFPEDFGPWIRPVSDRHTRELSNTDRFYENNQDPRVLDIIEIKLLRPEPEHHQTENHMIDNRYYWELVGQCNWHEIQRAVENPQGPLWINGYSSTNRINDRVPLHITTQLSSSLYLIQPEDFVLQIRNEITHYGMQRRILAYFNLHEEEYCIVVTDPRIENMYRHGNTRDIRLQNAILCVSLGEIFHGYSYKLAAAIITPE